MSPLKALRGLYKTFDKAFLTDGDDIDAILLKPNKVESFTSTESANIVDYSESGDPFSVTISPRTRREAQLFNSSINDVQGEIQLIVSLEVIARIEDGDIIRLGDADYAVRFDINEDNSHEPLGYIIAEKQSARAIVV